MVSARVSVYVCGESTEGSESESRGENLAERGGGPVKRNS